jgi:hypothetical protein
VIISEVKPTAKPSIDTGGRRHDIDWLRTLAMGLLILYHVVISFQSWGFAIGFPQNDQTLDRLWIWMAMINVWRIPILFLISGMGVAFAIQRRNWKQLLQDRTVRILLPFVFGYFFIAPIVAYGAMLFYDIDPVYQPGTAHLWFLGNIFAYVVLLLPLLMIMKKRPNNVVLRFLRRLVQLPGGIFLFALPLIVEALLVNPVEYVTYADTAHGFWLGMVCFLTGFIFISLKDDFWQRVVQLRGVALLLAFSFYVWRFSAFQLVGVPNGFIALESMLWMLAILGFGANNLNRPSRQLTYLNTAVYPVYIVHLPLQFLLAVLILPLSFTVGVKLLLLLLGTLGGSLLLYELVLKRMRWIRPLFGMKLAAE